MATMITDRTDLETATLADELHAEVLSAFRSAGAMAWDGGEELSLRDLIAVGLARVKAQEAKLRGQLNATRAVLSALVRRDEGKPFVIGADGDRVRVSPAVAAMIEEVRYF